MPRRFQVQRCGSTAQQVCLVALGHEERTDEQGCEHDPAPNRKSEIGARRPGRWRWRRDFALTLPANALVVRVVLTAGWTVHKQSQTENRSKSTIRIVTRVLDQDGTSPSDGTVSMSLTLVPGQPWAMTGRTQVTPVRMVSGSSPGYSTGISSWWLPGSAGRGGVPRICSCRGQSASLRKRRDEPRCVSTGPRWQAWVVLTSG